MSGHHRIDGRTSALGTGRFHPTDPRTGQSLTDSFPEATAEEITAAVDAALDAAAALTRLASGQRGAVLRRLADQLDRRAERLVALADLETGLGRGHLQEELRAGTRRLRVVGDRVARGEDVGVTIVTDGPGGAARTVWRPRGPVVVLGDAATPFVSGVPGADTATAIAAGCPVIAQANPLHPGTAEACAAVIDGVFAAAGLPAGAHALLHGRRPEVAEELVTAHGVTGVAYTGSRHFGRALLDLAAARPEPARFFGTFGSLNPAVVTAGAARSRPAQIAHELAAAVTDGCGQLLGRPGLLVVPADDSADELLGVLGERLRTTRAAPMVSADVQGSFAQAVARRSSASGVQTLVDRVIDAGQGYLQQPVLLSVGLDDFLVDPLLSEHCRGPLLLAVRTPPERLTELLGALPGSLVGTCWLGEEDPLAEACAEGLAARAGTVFVDGSGAGARPGWAVQAGPWPAASEPSWSAGGADAVRRWQRPVTYRAFRDTGLPAAVADANPWGIERTVDGRTTTGPLTVEDREG